MSRIQGTRRACFCCTQDKPGLKSMFFPKGLEPVFYGDDKNHLVCEKCRRENEKALASVQSNEEPAPALEEMPYEQKIGPSTPENLGPLFTKRW